MDCLKTIRELKAIGVGVCFEEQNIDSSMVSGETLASIFAALAQKDEGVDLVLRVRADTAVRRYPELSGFRLFCRRDGDKPRGRIQRQGTLCFLQNAHYTALINENPDWELVDIYADRGITGTSADK